MFNGYSYNERCMLSLAVVDEDVEIGDVLTLNGASRKSRKTSIEHPTSRPKYASRFPRRRTRRKSARVTPTPIAGAARRSKPLSSETNLGGGSSESPPFFFSDEILHLRGEPENYRRNRLRHLLVKPGQDSKVAAGYSSDGRCFDRSAPARTQFGGSYWNEIKQ